MTDPGDMRRELDQLWGGLVRLEQRIEQVDNGGTRGMGAVLVQVADLARSMGELRGQQEGWQHEHEKQHERDTAARTSGRRWLVGVGLTNAIAVGVPLLALVITHH